MQGMTVEDIRAVNELLQEQVEANLGMAMIYTLVSVLKEWLIDQVGSSDAFHRDSFRQQRHK